MPHPEVGSSDRRGGQRSGSSECGNPMSFRNDNSEYEAWLATQCNVVIKTSGKSTSR